MQPNCNFLIAKPAYKNKLYIQARSATSKTRLFTRKYRKKRTNWRVKTQTIQQNKKLKKEKIYPITQLKWSTAKPNNRQCDTVN